MIGFYLRVNGNVIFSRLLLLAILTCLIVGKKLRGRKFTNKSIVLRSANYQMKMLTVIILSCFRHFQNQFWLDKLQTFSEEYLYLCREILNLKTGERFFASSSAAYIYAWFRTFTHECTICRSRHSHSSRVLIILFYALGDKLLWIV